MDYILYGHLTTPLFPNDLESLANFEECSVEEHLRHAFIRLDHDIMSEGLPFGHGIGLNEQALRNGLSGSCACVAYVDETDLCTSCHQKISMEQDFQRDDPL
jgi:hypothetical protein